MVDATIEDLAFTKSSSRESDRVRRRGCIEHDYTKVKGIRINIGKGIGDVLIMRSSAAAEKSGKGMALKICTGAKPFLKAIIKPFDITEIRKLPLQDWKQILSRDEKDFLRRILLQMKDYSVGDELVGFAIGHIECEFVILQPCSLDLGYFFCVCDLQRIGLAC